MKTRTSRRVLYMGAALALLAACSDTTVSSPGGGGGVSPPPPPPPPPPPVTGDINLIPTGGCPTGTTADTVIDGGTTVAACQVTGNLTTDVVLAADGGYIISGPVFVGTDEGASAAGGVSTATVATLTIEAGATLFGESGSDYIVVARGSRIVAEGTEDDPIVFTSAADVAGNADYETDSGEWGGLVINGRAPINACDDGAAVGGTVDCEKSGEGSSGLFGGNDPDDDSGVLNYVRVQFAGFNINDEDQLNGIAFQGVGAGTDVDYIQVHNNEDDGVEFFGGTVNVKHVVLTGNKDDSFDVTDGWVGKAQFVVVQQSPDAGDRAFEMDNNGDENTALPISAPTVSNITIVSNPTSIVNSQGMLFREGLGGEFYNAVISRSPTCVDIDQTATADNVTSGDLVAASFLLDCPTPIDDDGDGIDEAAIFAGFDNIVIGETTLSDGYFPGPNELDVPVVDVAAMDDFFDDVDYIGAFSPEESAEDNWASGWTTSLVPEGEVACPTGTEETGEEIDDTIVCRVDGIITDDLTLVRGPMYELSGAVFVGRDMGADPAAPKAGGVSATLTIESGVTMFGASGSDYLVVARGSQIESNGTRNRPVVMTSRDDVEGNAGDTDSGEWGGLVINGRAPINACADGAVAGGSVGCEKSGEGSSGLFGGATADDDSGNLFYTVVKYAGFNINDEDQLNGIAFQGVGSETDVDYIQVHSNEDDGVEFFGGTVNVKHVVLTGNKDDSFDVTDGWVGKAQFVIVEQQPDAGDRGFEMDNNGDENTATPYSAPTISNMTVLSNSTSVVNTQGMLFREGLQGNFYNAIIAGSPTCVDIDQGATAINDANGDLVAASFFLDCPKNIDDDSDGIDEAAIFGAYEDIVMDDNTLSGFTFLDHPGGLGLVPGAAENAVDVVDVAAMDDFFDEVDFIGAVRDADDDWYADWTFDPSN